ncbi:CBS domain-containing protein [Streptomyces sp. NPDC058442]|uniref:CBS domain-containing protein n=1 Tax=Streptomyces sp. NPDC058442 TaxID=3346503 RepID=UPI0036545EF5
MDVPAAPVTGDTPFPDVARILSGEHLGPVPVVDNEGQVTGVASGADLLPKAGVP